MGADHKGPFIEYVAMHMSVLTYVGVYLSICLCDYVCALIRLEVIFIYIYIYIYTHTHVHVYVYVYLCMYMYVYMYICFF